MNTSLFSVILTGLCTVLHLVQAGVEIAQRAYRKSVAVYVINLVTAALWVASFVLTLIKFLSDLADPEEAPCE